MQFLNTLYEYQRDMDRHLSDMSIFIIKSVVITVCIIAIIGCFYSRYEFIDEKHVGDKFTGNIKTYSDYGHPGYWR